MGFLTPKYFKGTSLQIGLYAALTVFLTYTMVFGFRKSFTVATFDRITVAGYSYKTILVICQMLGYMLAKFYGIKYISELKRHGRGQIIMLLTLIAWLFGYFLRLYQHPIISYFYLSMVFL